MFEKYDLSCCRFIQLTLFTIIMTWQIRTIKMSELVCAIKGKVIYWYTLYFNIYIYIYFAWNHKFHTILCLLPYDLFIYVNAPKSFCNVIKISVAPRRIIIHGMLDHTTHGKQHHQTTILSNVIVILHKICFISLPLLCYACEYLT